MMWFRSRKLLFGGGEFCHEGVNFLVADGDAAFAKDFGNFRSEFASFGGGEKQCGSAANDCAAEECRD